MTSQVITSFSLAGAAQYGRRCVQSFRQHCRTPMVVYVDVPMILKGVEVRLTGNIPQWPETRARLPMRREDATRPDKYLWHARRFAVKPFVWLDAAEQLGEGILTWLDGDTLTNADIPEALFTDLLGDAEVAFLGRGPRHPENGYVGFRVPQALPLLRWMRDVYVSGEILRWADGWTDCHALRTGLKTLDVTARDLTTPVYVGKSNIWPVSPLAPYLIHNKGSKPQELVA